MNKAEFLHELAYLLIKHGDGMLIDIQYEDNDDFEIANILFADDEKRVNITGDSAPAMLIDIGKALMK